MNTPSSFTDFLQLLAVLAAEILLVTAVTAMLVRCAKSTAWRRALWQAGLVAVLVVTACEISGEARLLADWSELVLTRCYGAGQSVQENAKWSDSRLTDQFRSKVNGRLTGSPWNTPVHAATISPGPSGGVPVAPAPAVTPLASDFGPGSLNVLLLLVLWATGTALVAGRAWVGRCLLLLFRLRRPVLSDPVLLTRVHGLARALGMRRQVRVVESARLAGPIAFGLLHPTIGLPADFFTRFTPACQEAMLAHELAHLAAHDPAWLLLADISAALLWWHPAVWWARRQLTLASEIAADEASVVLKDGPAVLAECLAELGARLAGRTLGQLQVSGFRSHLGQRVQRLLHLESGDWSRPARLRAGILLTLGPPALAAVVVLCTAWVTPLALTKGKTMPSLEITWKRSLATLALLTVFHGSEPVTVAGAASPGAQPGSGGGPSAALNAVKPAAAPDGGTIQTAGPSAASADTARKALLRYGLEPRAAAAQNAPSSSPKRERIENKLNEITLSEVAFDGLPLSEVLKFLSDQSIKLDAEKQGINFLINYNNPPPAPGASIDPTTGLATPAPAESIDMGSIMVKFSLPLRKVSLKDTLEAIVRVAERPIQYSVEDYGVLLSLKSEPGVANNIPASTGTSPDSLVACTFKVDTNTFLAGLENAFGITVPTAAPGQTSSRARGIQNALRTLLTQLGVSEANARTVFYNDLTGMVMVRARQDEEGVIQAAVETLGGTPVGSYPTGAGSDSGGTFGLSAPGHR